MLEKIALLLSLIFSNKAILIERRYVILVCKNNNPWYFLKYQGLSASVDMYF